MRLLLVKLFPVLGGSSVRSRQHYYNYGSGTELKQMSQNKSRITNKSKNGGSPTSAEFSHDNTITVKTSYTVKHSQSKDIDEASLVSHGKVERV